MRLFLACTSDKQYCIQEVKEIDYILESFYYLQEWQIPIIKKCKMFLLDSGAFTFMNSNKGKINWDEYLDKYIKFINDNDIKYFFELDIDSVVGLKEVERLRKRLEKETGKKCIPVWHFNRGKDYYIKMCQEYDYVAFGGIITDGIKTKEILKYLPWFAKTAHKYKCKVHALGLTCKDIDKYGVDSVDSTSWKSGGRFGQLYLFDGQKIKQVSYDKKRISDYKKADIHNLREWVKYQKYLDR